VTWRDMVACNACQARGWCQISATWSTIVCHARMHSNASIKACTCLFFLPRRRRNTSDWNNALKLGFDPESEAYPEWMLRQVRLSGAAAGPALHPPCWRFIHPSGMWLQSCNTNAWLPCTLQEWAHLLPEQVVQPGAPVAALTAGAAQCSGLPAACLVCGGTTDSIAAFVAAGVTEVRFTAAVDSSSVICIAGC